MPPNPPLQDVGEDDNAIPLVSPRRNRSHDSLRDGKQYYNAHTVIEKGPPPSRRRVRSSTSRLLQKWWRELVCCLLVLATLLAITATLYPFSGKPLPQWPYGLSINTLLSIYVLMMKAAMLFLVAQGLGQLKWKWFEQTRPLNDLARYDDASRGSWGAVKLLWVFGGRNTFTTSLGAIVTILALGVDPFVQQIARYETCTEPNSRLEATIARTTTYADAESLHNGAGDGSLGAGSQAAISAGAFSASALNLPFNCPTGNCTFDQPYSSIGFCSSCSDISNELTYVNYTWRVVTAYYNETSSALNLTLPSGLYVPTNDGSVFALGAYVDEYSRATAIIDAIYHPPYNRTCAPSEQSWACKGRGAARCKLAPCLKSYTAQVRGGFLHETTESTSMSAWGGDYVSFNSVDMQCITETQKTLLRRVGYDFQPETRWLAYNVTVGLTGNTVPGPSAGHGLTFHADSSLNYPDATLSIVPAKCIYTIDGSAARSLVSWLADSFNGTLISAPGGTGVNNGDGEAASSGTSALILNLYDSGNATLSSIGRTFANITESITTYQRQNGAGPFDGPAVGMVTHNETCVRIRWAWLTFPAALAVMVLVFFAAMVYGTSRPGLEARRHDFKSSALPLVYHGLDSDVQENHARARWENMSQIDRDAKDKLVMLSFTEKGWRFVEMHRGMKNA